MSLQPNILPRLGRLATAIVVVLTLAPLGALGQERALERRVPASPNEVRLSYAPIVQRAAPAVVNVYAAKTVTVRNRLLDDPIFRRFFGVPDGPGGPGEQVQRSLGSGVLVDAAGLQATSKGARVGLRNGQVVVTDGPFAETKEQLAGFYLIEARDLNEAIQIAGKIPPAREGSIEVRPVRELDPQ
jgi:hypothetical protein